MCEESCELRFGELEGEERGCGDKDGRKGTFWMFLEDIVKVLVAGIFGSYEGSLEGQLLFFFFSKLGMRWTCIAFLTFLTFPKRCRVVADWGLKRCKLALGGLVKGEDSGLIILVKV